MKFETRDPFPFLNSFTKSEALVHAEKCDLWLGIRVRETEAILANCGSSRPAPLSSGVRQNLWFGLEPRELQTPFVEIRSLLRSVDAVRSFSSVVDLGAAYARIAFVIERHYPRVSFKGFEYVGERVTEARKALKRFGAQRSSVEHVDLTSPSFRMPAADVYFIYDYGTPAAIEKTLHDLRRVTRGREVTVIARGRVCRYAIESRHAFWLSKADPRAPERAFTVYSKSDSKIDLNSDSAGDSSPFEIKSNLGLIESSVERHVNIIDCADHT